MSAKFPFPTYYNETLVRKTRVQQIFEILKTNPKYVPIGTDNERIAENIRILAKRRTPCFHGKMRRVDVEELCAYQEFVARISLREAKQIDIMTRMTSTLWHHM